MLTDFQVLPLTESNWNDLIDLFGKTGGNGQCWCLAYRFSQKILSNIPHNERKDTLHSLVRFDLPTPGLIGYLNNKPIAWVGFSPKESFYKLTHSRVIKAFDNQKVWTIVCFYIKKDFRGKKVIYSMIQGVIDFASANNISIIETYPIELEENEWLTEPMIWFGTRRIFESLGFEKVGETSATSGSHKRVIMRYFLK